MNEMEREWRPIARLIAAEKDAALAELRRRPLAPLLPAAAPAPRRLSLVLLPVAASLLLAAGLAALWLLRGGWQGSSLAPPGSEVLADFFLYAAAAQAEAAAGPQAQDAASPYFTALAESAIGPQAAVQDVAGAETASRPAVERGDPEEVRRGIGRAIRENAFGRALAHLQEIHAQEA